MRRPLLILLVISPLITFAQSLMEPSTGAAIWSFISVAIIIGLFFLFRSVLLWYWKVDRIVKNQEETNRLLRSILGYMESKDDYKNKE